MAKIVAARGRARKPVAGTWNWADGFELAQCAPEGEGGSVCFAAVGEQIAAGSDSGMGPRKII